jgi:hypothetical protein
MEAFIVAVIFGLAIFAGWFAIEPLAHIASKKMKQLWAEAQTLLPFLGTLFR